MKEITKMDKVDKILDSRARGFNAKGLKYYNMYNATNHYDYTLEDVIKKFKDNPKCYLSGKDIDISKGNFHMDHIFPKYFMPINILDNMGMLAPEFNMWKGTKSIERLLKILQEILEYQGYTVIKPEKVTCQELIYHTRRLYDIYLQVEKECQKKIEYIDIGSEI